MQIMPTLQVLHLLIYCYHFLILASSLLCSACNLRTNIANIIYGFNSPIPNVVLLEYEYNLANFLPNPIFLRILGLHVVINSFSYFSLILIILHVKHTFLYKHMLKKTHTVKE